MYPYGGAGELTVLFTVDGEPHQYTRMIGTRNEGARWGVEIRIDPLGTVKTRVCRHPCPGSEKPWYEPYRTRFLQLLWLD